MTIRNIPESYRRTYDKAMTGKSRKAGVKSFCAECAGFVRNEVVLCSDTGCPLYPYRPFKRVKKTVETANPCPVTPL